MRVRSFVFVGSLALPAVALCGLGRVMRVR